MSAAALLERLASLHIELWLEGDTRLRFRAPQGVLGDSLRDELKEERDALIAHLQQAQAPGPLSLGQQALIFHNQLWPESSSYNVSLALRLRGPLVKECLAAALADLSARHPILATGLRATATGDELYRAAGAVLQLHITAPALSQELLHARMLAAAQVPFRLREEPLTRAVLYHCTDGDAVLHLCSHHLVVDGISFGLILRDLPVLYAHRRAGTPPPSPTRHSFSEFVRGQAAYLNSPAAAAGRRYWLAQLAGELPTLQLPVDRRRHGVRSEDGAEVPLQLGPLLSQQLRTLAVELEVTPSALLLAGFAALCARYGEHDELLVGVPYSGRSDPRFAEVVGYFVNTLPLRLRCDRRRSFAELAQATAAQLSDALTHGDYPLARLVQELPRARDPHAPLYQVSFSFHSQSTRELLQTVGFDATAALPFADLTALPFPLAQQNGQDDLGVTISDLGSEFAGKLSYSTELFTRATALRLTEHLGELLRGAVAAPALPIGELPLLSPQERTLVVETWNQTAQAAQAAWSLPRQLSIQAAAAPAAVALQTDERCLSYAELERQSNQLAWHLRGLGVGADVLVGIFLPRSPELVVAIWAIFKAGGAYLPLDPELPRERLRWQLSDSGIWLVLALRAQLPPGDAAVQVILMDEINLAQEPTTPPAVTVAPHHLAYALYTSGSTGLPKAALIEHGSLQNQLQWLQRTYDYTAADVTLHQTPATFDISVWEILVPLISGAPLVLARPGGHRDVGYLIALIERFAVRVVDFVPSLLRALLAELAPGRCRSLTHVFSIGEALEPKLAAACRRLLPQAALINMYGPTECTINVTSWPCGAEPESVPIGRPIDNTQIYILDPHRQPTPIGVAGELYIGGVQVGRGYLNRPELTRQKFIPDPFSSRPDYRLYQSGDSARFLPDGNIEFLGRLDYQVKLRGFRIELGEIEFVLGSLAAVAACAVLLREDVPGDRRLVAYVVAGAAVDPAALRQQLAEKLPEYMVPTAFVSLPALPLTANGKLDRKALPAPAGAVEEAPLVAPRTPTEQALAQIFSAVLNLPRVSLHDDFFSLGGHSLLAIQLVSRIRSVLRLELPLRELFLHPRLSAMAAWLDAQARRESP